MRFYKLTCLIKNTNPNDSQDTDRYISEWFESERLAVIRRLELYKTGQVVGKKSQQFIEAHDVPTNKAGLLEFIRENCT